MTESEKWELITAFVSGNASDEQLGIIDTLSETEKKEIDQIKSAYAHDKDIALSFDLSKGQALMHTKLSGKQQPEMIEPVAEPAKVRRPWKWMVGVAAASIVLVWIATWFSTEDSTELPLEYITETATRGSDRHQVVLADSSIVYINGQTSIRYPKKFAKNERRIFLEGDAFFEVKKDPARPFIVSSGSIYTEVLGTSFRIRSVKEQSLEVMVATGKVAVKKDSALLSVLTPGTGLEYNERNNRYTTRHYPQEEIYGIHKQVLVFNNTPMPAVMHELEKWFGVTILLDSSITQAGSINGSFSNFSLEDILRSIAISSDIRYRRSADTIHIKSKL